MSKHQTLARALMVFALGLITWTVLVRAVPMAVCDPTAQIPCQEATLTSRILVDLMIVAASAALVSFLLVIFKNTHGLHADGILMYLIAVLLASVGTFLICGVEPSGCLMDPSSSVQNCPTSIPTLR